MFAAPRAARNETEVLTTEHRNRNGPTTEGQERRETTKRPEAGQTFLWVGTTAAKQTTEETKQQQERFELKPVQVVVVVVVVSTE